MPDVHELGMWIVSLQIVYSKFATHETCMRFGFPIMITRQTSTHTWLGWLRTTYLPHFGTSIQFVWLLVLHWCGLSFHKREKIPFGLNNGDGWFRIKWVLCPTGNARIEWNFPMWFVNRTLLESNGESYIES